MKKRPLTNRLPISRVKSFLRGQSAPISRVKSFLRGRSGEPKNNGQNVKLKFEEKGL